MNQAILLAVAALGAIGIASAVILYFVAQKFKVIEDPRIDQVNDLLPGANCDGCGFAGCRNFAESIIKAGSLEGMNCPVGGNTVMKQVAAELGWEAAESDPMIAVIRCFGSRIHAPAKLVYDGASSCQFAHSLYNGESGCPNGCIGLADCVNACQFDAMYMDEETGLPVIIEDKCVNCGACVKSCPRKIIEMRKKGPKSRRIYVGCINTEKGVISKKNCEVACIGCGKCVKICKFEAITLEHNLAYIDFGKCTLCRKCVEECPTHSIYEINFSPRKPKQEVEVKEEVGV
ncbi:MAG: RnfABCDGE type electron transport complex subunit B [Bacteroidales bacterium]|nr:RnfABCDGE type electron transport complex subunit B [Bacteroidales bacterium]